MESMREATRRRRNRSFVHRREFTGEPLRRPPMEPVREPNTRRRRNRSFVRRRGSTGEPASVGDIVPEQGDFGPVTDVPHPSAGEGRLGAGSSHLENEEDVVAQADGNPIVVEPLQEEDDDTQILWSRLGGSEAEARNEISDAAETAQEDVENSRKRKITTMDEEASESAASCETVPESCIICMEPMRDSGDHRICCLVCGHLFGLKCIEHWLRACGKKKCPQCLRKAKKEDIRVLFTPRVVVADGRTLQETVTLTNENTKLKTEISRLKKSLQNTKKRLASSQAIGVTSVNGNTAGDMRDAFIDAARSKVVPLGTVGRFATTGGEFQRSSVPTNFPGERRSLHDFQITGNETNLLELTTIPVNGSKAFDMDAYQQILLFSNRTDNSASASGFGLSKMNLLDVRVIEKLNVQSDLGAIRDVRIAGPAHQGNLALVASIKKLSIVSMGNNSVVLSHNVSSPAWSCAWDPCDPNLLFAGLQNGSLLIFDIRQTASPVTTWEGPEPRVPGSFCRPVHSLQVISERINISEPTSANLGAGHLGGSQILGASVQGVFSWNANSLAAANAVSRATWIFTAAEKLCSSVVYDKATEIAVASLRPSPTLRLTPSILASRDGLPESSHGSGDTSAVSQPSTSLPTRLDQFTSSPSRMCAPSAAALNRDTASHWMLRRDDVSRNTDADLGSQASNSAGISSRWKWVGEMTGHRSQTALSRGVIIPRSNGTTLFASGDKLACSVSLWDMDSSRLLQTLNPHESSVVDLRHIQLHDIDLMGSLSEKALRLYRRKRE